MFLMGSGVPPAIANVSYLSVFGGYNDTAAFAPPAVDGSGACYLPGYVFTTGGLYRGAMISTTAAGAIVLQRVLTHATEDVRLYRSGLDGAGNIYCLGNQWNKASPTNSYKLVLVKYNSSGVLQWQRLLSKSGGDFVEANLGFAVTSAGDCYIGSAHNNAGPSAGNYYPVVLKYNSAGTLQWQYYVDSVSGSNLIFNIAFDAASSSLYLVGLRLSANNRLILKLDVSATPTVSWALQDTANTGDQGKGVAVAANGDVLMSTFVDPGGVQFMQLDRLTSAGAGVWRASVFRSGGTNWVLPSYTQVDGSGNIYVSALQGDPVGAPTAFKALACKFDSSGNVLWLRTLTPPANAAQYLGIAPIGASSVLKVAYASATGLVVLRVPAAGTFTGTYSGYVYAAAASLATTLGSVVGLSSLAPTLAASTITDAAAALTDSTGAVTRTLTNIP